MIMSVGKESGTHYKQKVSFQSVNQSQCEQTSIRFEQEFNFKLNHSDNQSSDDR